MQSEAPHKKSRGLLVGGWAAALIGAIVLAAGGAALWAETQRDANGYFSTNAHMYESGTRAIVTEGINVGSAVPTWLAGNVRLDVSGEKPVFVGIARKATVDAYLAGVAHAEATDLDLDPFEVTYVNRAGTAAPERPAEQPFWEATSSGAAHPLTWRLRSGKWSIVVMNADGSPDVAASIAVGVKVPALLWVGIGLTAFGGALLVAAGPMFRARSRAHPRATTSTALAG
jgi:hypothetical protein